MAIGQIWSDGNNVLGEAIARDEAYLRTRATVREIQGHLAELYGIDVSP